MKELRKPLDPWFTGAGFRRLGARGWQREHSDHGHLLVAVQASQGGWDAHRGNRFVVEIELSSTPKFSTGSFRDRIWRLMDVTERIEAIAIISEVARALPAPDAALLAQFPEDMRRSYMRNWHPEHTTDSSDVWFNYYDETDAAKWAEFLSRVLAPAIDRFVDEPTFFGARRD